MNPAQFVSKNETVYFLGLTMKWHQRNSATSKFSKLSTFESQISPSDTLPVAETRHNRSDFATGVQSDTTRHPWPIARSILRQRDVLNSKQVYISDGPRLLHATHRIVSPVARSCPTEQEPRKSNGNLYGDRRFLLNATQFKRTAPRTDCSLLQAVTT